MSQILNRVVKSLVYKNVLRHNNNNKIVRWYSDMTIYPNMLLNHILKLADSSKDSSDGHITIGEASPRHQKHILIKDKELVEEVRNAMTPGYSNDKLKVRITRKKPGVHIYIHYNSIDYLSSVSVHPPHLPNGSVIQNIAMSSYPVKENKDDWVMAIKLYGSKIKLYRRDEPRWIDAKAMPESIYTSSSLMYSKKDQRFYVPTPGSNFLYSLDLNYKENGHPEFISLWTEDLSKYLTELELADVNSFAKTVHFVEAPSGKQFLVKWLLWDQHEPYNGLEEVTSRTIQFLVLRAEDDPLQEKRKKLFYTDGIGDLCIFLGHGEPFCVRASSHPGLRRNCIYFVGYNFGVYDITQQCCNLFYDGEDVLRSTEFPYWPHP